MDKTTCPICGREVSVEKLFILDNGNPACSNCVDKENEFVETETEKEQ